MQSMTLNEKIRKKLFELSDEKYKKFHSGLCPNIENIIGVRVPVLRNYAKEIVKNEDIEAYLKNAQNDYYEEIMLQGMVIGMAKFTVTETQEHLKKFIPKINNWGVCDTCVAGLKIIKNNKKEFWDFLKPYLKSEKEFELRFGVVTLLDFYIVPEYIEQILIELDKIKHDGYYVKMAIAWAISICYIKFPKETKRYLENNTLDDFTYNKAIQKIIESYRVSEEDKQALRKMKK